MKTVAQVTSPGFVIRDGINGQVVLVTEKGELQNYKTYTGGRRRLTLVTLSVMVTLSMSLP